MKRFQSSRVVRSVLLCLAACWLSACGPPPSATPYPPSASVESRVLLRSAAGAVIYHGGFGSSMVLHPSRPGHFYLLTDRGPNVDSARSNGKLFPVPAFTPLIGLFRLDGATLRLVSSLELRTPSANKITGLPNRTEPAEAWEGAVDADGNLLRPDPDGLDPEGLVALADGTFWISDEYGPHLLHVDAAGRTIERISPSGAAAERHVLPRVFATRRPNHGMEGLTITPDGKTLVGIMQSALDNPSAPFGKTSRASRVIAYDLATGASRQYVYLQDEPDLSNSEIAALSATVFLVLERDDLFGGDPAAPARYKRIYRIDTSRATDVNDPADEPHGRLFGGKTLEQLGEAERAVAGIVPVSKVLVVDLLAAPGGYPHDKPEGFTVVNPTLLGVCNDDDFGITSGAAGGFVQKMLPGAGDSLDRNVVYFVPLKTPVH